MIPPTSQNAPGTVGIEGIGFWGNGLPSWEAACAFAATGALPVDAPVRPSPQLLAPNERRRAPQTVAIALEVASAACLAAQRDAATLPSIFTSTHGDLAVTDAMCEAVANDPLSVSPIRFHNSVHNAAAGYWTIGVGSMRPATALSAYDASFAQGLIEAIATLAADDTQDAVLLVGYDSQATGPLSTLWRSEGLLGGALVLSRNPKPGALRLHATLESNAPASDAADEPGALQSQFAGNAMAPMLALFDLLARVGVPADKGDSSHTAWLPAGPMQRLRLQIE
ncbi:MAG: beta-ketoacyl synthase chain length factor [Burkholderiales bacterium]